MDTGVMDRKVMTDTQRNNKTAMYCHLVESLIIAGTYIAELVMGKIGAGHALLIAMLAIVPVIAELYFWSRNHESPMIKHLVAQGFAVMYTVILFTTENSMTFLYVIPMVLVISIYNDTAYSVKINIGVILENLIVVIGGAMTGRFGYRDASSGLLQLMVIILVGVFSYFAARTSERNNRQKLDNIKEAHDQTEQVLQKISRVSEQMHAGIEEIHEKVEVLEETSRTTRDAMEEVAAGANDTADAVQKQIRQTETIGEKVKMVDGAADEISDRMEKTFQVLAAGKKDVENLANEVERSVNNGVDAAGKLETLNGYITEMNSIVELIGGITAQTSLLSLNASIEAARAGDAGRGFAVVATEISALAAQTKEATAHITELIGNVSGSVTEVVTVIRSMIDGINNEKSATENTVASFETIEEQTYAIRDNVQRLADSVAQLTLANHEIAESVQTISAVSEEVSAHANETLYAEDTNMKNLLAITAKSQELIALTQAQNA